MARQELLQDVHEEEQAWTLSELYEQPFLWTVVDEGVYAIGPFLPHHPGGRELINRAIGEDVTVLYHTHHTSERVDRILEQYRIGHVARNASRAAPRPPRKRRPLQEELNRRIGALGLEKASSAWPLAEAVAFGMLLLYFAWCWLSYVEGWWKLNVALAWFWWRHLDSGLHSAVHGDFRASPLCHSLLLNAYKVLAHRAVEYYDGDTSCSYRGLSKHFWHHVYTNDPAKDPDWGTMTGLLWVRRHFTATWLPCHRWQLWYWLPVATIVEPCLELLHVAIQCLERGAALLEPPPPPTNDEDNSSPGNALWHWTECLWHRGCSALGLWMEMAIGPGFQGLALLFNPPLDALATLLVARALAKIVLLPFAEVQHYMPELVPMSPSEPEDDREWVDEQLQTTANLKLPTCFARWLDFLMFHGDSFQIEHHLWPAMSFVNYRRASIEVKAVCSEYNLPYHEVGFIEGYRKIWRQVWLHSQQVAPERAFLLGAATSSSSSEDAGAIVPHPPVVDPATDAAAIAAPDASGVAAAPAPVPDPAAAAAAAAVSAASIGEHSPDHLPCKGSAESCDHFARRKREIDDQELLRISSKKPRNS
mmetsp:Transcript_71946/g.156768  ORF Transcript_71946/g.156768 Transcript_71946/m.156768 type:complete len:591 (-) Transcript_71946:8-1780(-)